MTAAAASSMRPVGRRTCWPEPLPQLLPRCHTCAAGRRRHRRRLTAVAPLATRRLADWPGCGQLRARPRRGDAQDRASDGSRAAVRLEQRATRAPSASTSLWSWRRRLSSSAAMSAATNTSGVLEWRRGRAQLLPSSSSSSPTARVFDTPSASSSSASSRLATTTSTWRLAPFASFTARCER